MGALQFDEVIALINQSRTTNIDSRPSLSGSGWSCYKGRYRIQGKDFPFEVLYLDSTVLNDGLQDARRKAFKKGITQVVYSPTLDASGRIKHKDLFSADADKFLDLKEYLASFLKDELDSYRKRLKESLSPRYFVEPPVQVPAGLVTRAASPTLFRFFDDPLTSEAQENGLLGVLLADPGHGKTYTSEYIVTQLASRSDAIPIYISAPQWTSMSIDDLGSLWKTIAFSFRYFEAPIGWLDGCELEFLQTTLKAGLFKIVFDGFDEYVLKNQGRVTAVEALDALESLVKSTGCRLLVTSRTSFWNAELVDSGLDEQLKNVLLYRLQPFSSANANDYFGRRFPNDASKKKRAGALFLQLADRGRDFAGRGFVLSLIADVVSHGDSVTLDTNVGHPAKWLINNLCQREQLRQGLPINADQQLFAFKIALSQQVQGIPLSTDTLDLAIDLAADSQLDQQTRMSCLKSLKSHPLVSYETTWSFTQDQVRIVLFADYLIQLINDPRAEAELLALSEKGELSNAEVGDVTHAMVEIIEAELASGFQPLAESIGAHAKKLMSVSRCQKHGDRALTKRLATSLAMNAVDRLMASGTSHRDRTDLLLRLIGRETDLHDLCFFGAVTRFDFAGITFSNCYFERVRWANCTFDKATRFASCHFVGGTQNYCKGLELSEWHDPVMDEDGRAFVNAALVGSGRKVYSQNDLQEDIKTVIEKFSVKGGMVLKTVRNEHLDSGSISTSRFKAAILEELKKRVIEPHEIASPRDERFDVREDAKECVRFLATNNVLTGPLKECFDRLVEKFDIPK